MIVRSLQKKSHDILTVIVSYCINFSLLLLSTIPWNVVLLACNTVAFTVTQISCIPLYYNHETRLTALGHISQSIAWLCPSCLVYKIWYNYMNMSYFLQIRKSNMLKCASLNQTAKLVLLDPWSWDRQLSWNISNSRSVLHNITGEQRTNLYHGRSLISCMLLLVLLLVKRLKHFDECQR